MATVIDTLRERKKQMQMAMDAENPNTPLPGDKKAPPPPPPEETKKKKKSWWQIF